MVDRTFEIDIGSLSKDDNARIVMYYIRTQHIRYVLLLGVSVIFILSACFLLAFAPSDRMSLIYPVSLALAAVGAGLGGFSTLRISVPGASISASSDSKA
jgi:hypothetical protein